MSQNAIDTFSVTRQAIDPRADDARRIVYVSATSVTIERVVHGMRMRIGVPVNAYKELVLGVRQPTGHATLILRHHDKELEVTLDSGEAIGLARKAKAWSHLFGLAVVVEEACISMRPTIARRKGRAKPSRRSTFARRRARGVMGRPARTFAGEHEIIARN